MAKYIELIDKYLIEQNSDGGYNPPSYIWTDNTGSITRCEECKYCDTEDEERYAYCNKWQRETQSDWYCSRGKQDEIDNPDEKN